jgi:hypothetical protein
VTYVSSSPSGSPNPSGLPVPLGGPANSTVPRIPAITQFDGGPLGNANCTLASGAMLARLAFGIVTTGSQLRSLQDDQEGGTSLGDLETALQRGWGVQFNRGVLTPLQLRALLFGGAGVEIGGIYGVIPVELRLQKNFTEGHAIYLDGFRGPGPEGPAAYYVIDPIGRPWQGYRGAWWPADIVEAFGIALGVRTGSGGPGIGAVWGFPGGATPTTHPILPPDAYPGALPNPSLPAPGTTPVPLIDQMPTDSIGELPAADQGDKPPDSPPPQTIQIGPDGTSLSSLLARCAAVPRPAG